MIWRNKLNQPKVFGLEAGANWTLLSQPHQLEPNLPESLADSLLDIFIKLYGHDICSIFFSKHFVVFFPINLPFLKQTFRIMYKGSANGGHVTAHAGSCHHLEGGGLTLTPRDCSDDLLALKGDGQKRLLPQSNTRVFMVGAEVRKETGRH